MFRGKIPTFSKNLFSFQKKSIATKEFKSNVDNKLNSILKQAIPGKSVATFLAGVNIAIFLYSNARLNKTKRFDALDGVSYSLANFRHRDLIPLINSLLGSRRIEDLALETGVLLTIGKIVTLFLQAKCLKNNTELRFYSNSGSDHSISVS